ncbi:MAG: hypothetical protein HY774_00720 [Acidobacteria bacterium]|nr:hypothetical protein [Acidobacteriota bacterium]
MSDPVNVIFHSPSRLAIGPMIYLHWGRDGLLEYLRFALPRMRTGDVEYASARFIGCCHENLPGANSLGCSNLFLPLPAEDEDEFGIYEKIISEIPAEIAKVNVDTWTVDWEGNTIQLPSELAVKATGFG